MSLHWLDNADSWICPICGFETSSPAKYKGCKCPACGFQDDKDKAESEKKAYRKIESIPYLMHKELDMPISECQKAYDVAIEYLRSHAKVKC